MYSAIYIEGRQPRTAALAALQEPEEGLQQLKGFLQELPMKPPSETSLSPRYSPAAFTAPSGRVMSLPCQGTTGNTAVGAVGGKPRPRASAVMILSAAEGSTALPTKVQYCTQEFLAVHTYQVPAQSIGEPTEAATDGTALTHIHCSALLISTATAAAGTAPVAPIIITEDHSINYTGQKFQQDLLKSTQ